MGAGDFAPASSGRMKPVTKKELEAMRKQYAAASKKAEGLREKEELERQKWQEELDDEINSL